MTRQAAPTHGEAGFALLIVLWALGLLALLVTGLTGSGRTQIALAEAARAAAVAEAAADGAVQRAIYQARDGTWPADGQPRRVVIGRATVEVMVEDQSERINPNYSSPALLASLLTASGLPTEPALELARRMVDWRTATPFAIEGGLKLDRYRQAGLPYGPPDRPFATVDEIGLVAGVTPVLLDRLRPFVSVDQTGDPRLAAAAAAGGAAVRQAEMTAHAPVLIGFVSPDQTVQIRAAAVLPNGIRFVRTAVVRLQKQPGPDERGWQILHWR